MASRTPRHARRFFEAAKAYDGDECLMWPYANIKGYAALRVDGRTEYVCRLLCEGEPSADKPNVLHRCGRGAEGCVTKKHLYWGDQRQNCADREAHGTVNRGKRNGHAILAEAQVHEIRALRRVKTYEQIAAQFNVSRGCIRDIMTGRNWSWLEEQN